MRGGRVGPRWLVTVIGLMAAMVGALLGFAPATSGNAAEPVPRRVLHDIHTDAVYVVFEDGKLDLKTRVGNACCFEFLDPGELIFQLKDTADSRLEVPDAPEFAFLGAPGAPIWLAPEIQIPDLVWPGWGTEDPSMRPELFQGGTVDISLVGASGPGRVEVFDSGDEVEPRRIFSSADPSFRTWREGVGAGHHHHANWIFTELGAYTLTFEVTATAAGGAALSTGPVSLTWYVGGTTAADVVPAATGTTLSASPPTAGAGDEVALTATIAPRASGWLEFFDGATSLGRQRVRGGGATLRTTALAQGQHSLTAVYTSEHTNDYLASTSPAVAYSVSAPGTGPTPSPTVTPTSTGTPRPTDTSAAPSRAPTSTSSRPAGGGGGAGDENGDGSGGGSGGSSGAGGETADTKCVPATGSSSGSGGSSGGSGGSSGGGGVATDAVVLDNGHVDYGARISGGRLQSLIKDGTQTGRTTWREPAKVIFHLKSAAKTTIPAGFGFLGGAGSAIWQVPQTQKAGILWLGWNTEEISASQARGGVSWRLDKVTGPGRMAIYEFTTFGQPRVIFNSGDGLPDGTTIPLGTHAHGNWAFTREGIYRLTFTQTVTLAGGGTSTDTETVTFAVGNVDPATARGGSVSTQSLRMRPVAGRQPLAGLDTRLTVAAAKCGLPFTGAAVLVPAALGSGLLAIGAVAAGATYRRRRARPTRP